MMSGDREQGEDQSEPGEAAPARAAKKTYQRPALIRYGTLAEMTGNMAPGSNSDSMAKMRTM
jgi:hypothetical protein